jgi:hypothetical protein
LLKFMDPNFTEVHRWRTVSIFEEADSPRVVYWYGDAGLQTCYEPKFLNWIKLGMNVGAMWWLCRVFKLCLKCELCAHTISVLRQTEEELSMGRKIRKFFGKGLNGLLPCSACWMW